MRTLGITVWTLGLAAVMAAPAQAQGFRGRGMGMGSGYMLLTNKSVQQEIKLDETQIAKTTKVVEDAGAKMREKMEDIPDDQRRERIPQIFRAANEEVKSALKDVLKPEQMTRLEQISRQQQGIQAFTDPTVQEKLQLSDDQKSRLKEISDNSSTQMREIFSNAGDDRQAAMQKMTALRKETLEKGVAVLSDDQKKTWKDLTGEPFEVKFEPRRGN